ncbi:GT2 family glycosyltransferase [Clostridium acetobutylicum]|uniref:Glycosyltransferase n=1 Tax=Clostridium acetobutylicum (strain ATCC 824 / DSM 792 / JCM 1419 / IAM 19013 / LMG 5710 / NBRC 13948 / NRRL B-527 / VKM B-1787 / 2291 / W) TaxID=272562 RepID=Q97GL9_CLOAB|nr:MULTISPECIES: glycosyltransferase family 2 protein [Clostridium]AAK80303.1 Glycosyltransferase [Clostridium acetobutylicum ATCC 824]ADZ21398.1 Glycosyltransferase [Clostridium acetobutylicum EA 2018]AEI32294.1 glycosyltransferase [Clostridium acetobutylicum DSM 1731]AWV79276.1 glycosyltransferase family 2 protein [Clostridium acetobutylicum]MBC2394755.1 glycosyltransferase family 2 protein [Clostridium acetobutylicum]
MKTSIIILTCNNLRYSRRCIESIKKYTEKEAYEIIVVDNNSNDGTRNWLSKQKAIKKIYNNVNVGFPRGCNMGIKVACGSEVLLLNNDVVVTHNWLNNLRNCLYSSYEIGAVGPISNNCSNGQKINVRYDSIEDMHRFSKKYNISNKKKWTEVKRLIGFCFLIKRNVIRKVGLFDERFTPGNFEDDDYCIRMRKIGFRLMLCKDTFVHHYGSVSFKNTQYLKLLEVNKSKLEKKWGKSYDKLV